MFPKCQVWVHYCLLCFSMISWILILKYYYMQMKSKFSNRLKTKNITECYRMIWTSLLFWSQQNLTPLCLDKTCGRSVAWKTNLSYPYAINNQLIIVKSEVRDLGHIHSKLYFSKHVKLILPKTHRNLKWIAREFHNTLLPFVTYSSLLW